jgi:branched-chain amino acid transport system substrate-binding protein
MTTSRTPATRCASTKLITDDKVELLLAPWGTPITSRADPGKAGSDGRQHRVLGAAPMLAGYIWFTTSAHRQDGRATREMAKANGYRVPRSSPTFCRWRRRSRPRSCRRAEEPHRVEGERKYPPDIKDMTAILIR